MEALGRVPDAVADLVLNAEGVVSRHGRLALSEVLRLAEYVRRDCLHVFNRLLNDHSFGERVVEALVVNRHCRPVNQALLSISETVCRLIEAPVVTAVLLLARCEVPMGLDVHLSDGLVVLDVGLRIEDLFDCLTASSEAGHAKLEVACLDGLRPLIVTLEALGQRLSDLRGILGLLDVVELLSHTLQVLCLDHGVDVVGAEGLLAEAALVRDGVVDHARVDLLNARLVLETLAVTLDVLGGPRPVAFEDVRLQAECAAFVRPTPGDYLAGGAGARVAFETRS